MVELFTISNITLKFTTDLTFDEVDQMDKKLLSKRHEFEVIDLSAVEKIDSAGVAFLEALQVGKEQKTKLVNVNDNCRQVLETFQSKDYDYTTEQHRPSFFEKLYTLYEKSKNHTKGMALLTAEIVVWSVMDLFNSRGRQKGAVFQQSILLGVNAFNIISLMSIILGLILALQSAAQLRQFGANIFVADLLAISMVREMGPMMTAIIIAGRSGSSIASEVATMKVSEELDALKTMAVNPLRYVIVPKFIAITFCMPLLVTISIMMGIFGGLIIAVTYLDLSMYAFFTQLFSVLTLKDITIGLSKSFFFAWNIVLIGSYFGLQVEGGAEGVGKVTTSSVVVSIFAVIIFDAIFSLFYMI